MLLCLTGAALVLLASGRPWARAVLRQPPLPAVGLTVNGRSVAPVVAALGLVGLGGAVAGVASRGTWRAVTGVLLALAGAGVVVASLQVRLDLPRAIRPAAERISGIRGVTVPAAQATAWPSVSAVGGAILCGAGALTVVRGRRWTTLSSRYDAPGADLPPGPQDPAEIWDALDRGHDPTR